jgi:type IV pilus assembly protein PilV
MATSAENGFSLIEVLVSIFILAVGVVGAAAMQLSALRTAQQSAFQTTAAHLALEIAEAMLATPVGAHANLYLGLDYQATAHPAPATHYCYGKDTACDAKALAGFEIQNFLERLTRELPDARIRICQDAQPWDEVARQYRWDCRHAPHAAVAIKLAWTRQESAAHSEAMNIKPLFVLMLALPAK